MQVTAFSFSFFLFFLIPKSTSTRMNRCIWHISCPSLARSLSPVCYRGLKNRPNTIKKKPSPSTPVQAMQVSTVNPHSPPPTHTHPPWGPFACKNQMLLNMKSKVRSPKVGHYKDMIPFDLNSNNQQMIEMILQHP